MKNQKLRSSVILLLSLKLFACAPSGPETQPRFNAKQQDQSHQVQSELDLRASGCEFARAKATFLRCQKTNNDKQLYTQTVNAVIYTSGAQAKLSQNRISTLTALALMEKSLAAKQFLVQVRAQDSLSLIYATSKSNDLEAAQRYFQAGLRSIAIVDQVIVDQDDSAHPVRIFGSGDANYSQSLVGRLRREIDRHLSTQQLTHEKVVILQTMANTLDLIQEALLEKKRQGAQ